MKALSELGLPSRLEGTEGMSIVDIVITAGTGKKYGPEAGYVTAPMRMDDGQYSIFNKKALDDTFTDDVASLEKAADDASPLRRREVLATPEPSGIEFSSPESRHRTQHSTGDSPQTPTKQSTLDLILGLDLETMDLSMTVDAFENARGKRASGRTLKQRLGDLKKMSPKNQEKHAAVLRAELGEDALRSLNKEAEGEDEVQPSPTKKAKLDTQGRCDLSKSLLADAALAGPLTIDPTKIVRHMSLPSLLPEGAEPGAMLTQNRIDMALEAGAAFSGPLLRRIVSSSPRRTPQRKTRASALANSPCSLPVKEPLQKGRTVRTPIQNGGGPTWHHPDGSIIPVDPALTGSPLNTSRRTGRGANRTAQAWNPTEKTAQDALREFKNPESCEGGVVSYAEDAKAQRQVGKARNGEFHEESLVVGMRFVVV